MAINSLRRTRQRPDNLKNQVRPAQSFARRVYLGMLLLGAGWIAMQVFGPMVFMDADGLVVQDRAVVMPSYTAQVASVTVTSGEVVEQGQRIGTVISTQMLDLISDLTSRYAQSESRKQQIKARLEAIKSTLPAADKLIQDSVQAMQSIEKAKANGFSTVTRQAEVSQQRFAALREGSSLRAEASGLNSEAAALEQNAARIKTALENATETYRDGEIVAPVDGIIGPKVASAGTVLGPGESLTTIHHGGKYVIGYFPTSRLYAVKTGERVVITDGVNRTAARIQRVDGLADKVPEEFQSSFRSIERAQVVRLDMDSSRPFPLFAKVKVTSTLAPKNLFDRATSYVITMLNAGSKALADTVK